MRSKIVLFLVMSSFIVAGGCSTIQIYPVVTSPIPEGGQSAHVSAYVIKDGELWYCFGSEAKKVILDEKPIEKN